MTAIGFGSGSGLLARFLPRSPPSDSEVVETCVCSKLAGESGPAGDCSVLLSSWPPCMLESGVVEPPCPGVFGT